MGSTLVSRNALNTDIMTSRREIGAILRNFLKCSATTLDDVPLTEEYRSGKLYEDITKIVADLLTATGDNPELVDKIAIFSCDVAGNAYKHTSPEHQHYIALYTVCLTFADDLGDRHLESLAQFSRLFAAGQKQLNPAMEVLADLLRQSYDLWPQVGADAIVTGTLASIAAMYIEFTTGDMPITPRATWWPNYIRNKAGICPPYAHFNFMKSWRSSPDSYIQLLPYLEFYVAGANDVLSFYKEELGGETANYMHLRATTDETTPVDTMRLLADETLACMKRITSLIGDDPELMKIWRSHEQGFIGFHVKTPRYHMAEVTNSKDE